MTNQNEDTESKVESIKNFPRFLLDNGLIFEINRRVLHPLGLAMVVDIDKNNRRQLAITAVLKTEDMDGFIYEEESFSLGVEKLQKFLKKIDADDRIAQRKEKYGFIEQDKEV